MGCTRVDPKAVPDALTQVIAIDFDGVVTDHTSVKSTKFRKRGFDLDPSETDRQFCINRRGVPEEIYNEVSRETNLSLETTPLRTGVYDGLISLQNAGYTPVIITSRYDDEATAMMEYIDHHDLPVDWYINTDRRPKSAALVATDAIALIDDSYYKIKAVSESPAVNGRDLLFFRHEANRYREIDTPAVGTVNGWSELVDIYC